MPNNEQPDFDEEFDQAVAEWRDEHRLREDDAVMLLVELFRIHQRHWDEVRRREIPSFEQFRANIAKLAESARKFQGQSVALLEVLRSHPPGPSCCKNHSRRRCYFEDRAQAVGAAAVSRPTKISISPLRVGLG